MSGALMVPVEGLIEWFWHDVDIPAEMALRGVTNLVTVNFGTEGVEHGATTFSMADGLEHNKRATSITALLTRGSYVRVNGLAFFTGITDADVTLIMASL